MTASDYVPTYRDLQLASKGLPQKPFDHPSWLAEATIGSG